MSVCACVKIFSVQRQKLAFRQLKQKSPRVETAGKEVGSE